MLSIIKACYGLERVLWTGKGKPESERNRDVLKICEYRRENMGGMDMFVGEQMNLLELDHFTVKENFNTRSRQQNS